MKDLPVAMKSNILVLPKGEWDYGAKELKALFVTSIYYSTGSMTKVHVFKDW